MAKFKFAVYFDSVCLVTPSQAEPYRTGGGEAATRAPAWHGGGYKRRAGMVEPENI